VPWRRGCPWNTFCQLRQVSTLREGEAICRFLCIQKSTARLSANRRAASLILSFPKEPTARLLLQQQHLLSLSKLTGVEAVEVHAAGQA
jgi:hypothetical protein